MAPKAGRWLTILALLLLSLLAVWQPAPAQARAAVYVTSQQYDGGRMYYRADTGHIWVLYNSGQYANYPSSSYTNLPDNPFINPPTAHIRPIFGFGKVWGGYADVRTRLGWATTQELGFYTSIVSQSGLVYLTEIDGKIIQLNVNGTWQYVSGVPQPPANAPRVVRLDASPKPVTPGTTLNVSWEVTGTDLVLLELYDTANPAVPFTLLQGLPLSGTTPITVPATTAGDVKITIWGANRYLSYTPVPMYLRLVQHSITVGVQHPAAQTTYAQAAYQKFERGFMIWRGDTGAVIVFWGSQGGQTTTVPLIIYSVMPDNPVIYVPSGRVLPISGFGKVWGNYPAVRDGLGYALGPEESYTLTIQTSGTGVQSFRLPDGRWANVTGTSWTF